MTRYFDVWQERFASIVMIALMEQICRYIARIAGSQWMRDSFETS